MVKNISIQKAKTDPTNSVIYNYNLKDNVLLTSIQYQDKNIIALDGSTNTTGIVNVVCVRDSKL